MVEYVDAISKGLGFCWKPKRWLQLFVLDIIFLAIAGMYALPKMDGLVAVLSAMTEASTAAFMPAILEMILVFAALFIVWGLIRIWIQGALIQQCFKEKDIIGSTYSFAKGRYLTLLFTSIVIGIISGVAGIVPWIGWLLQIVVALLFFFALQSVIVGKLGVEKSLRESYDMFMKKKAEVLISWLLIAIISAIIVFVFMIPIFTVMSGSVLPALASASEAGVVSQSELIMLMSDSLMNNMAGLIAGAVIFMIGSSLATCFSLKAQTDIYLQLKGKKGLLKK